MSASPVRPASETVTTVGTDGTTATNTVASPVSVYTYAADRVVSDYTSGAVRLDVAKRHAESAMRDATIAASDATVALVAADPTTPEFAEIMARMVAASADARTHADVINALDAAAKSAKSTARQIDVSDYVSRVVGRVVAMRDTAYALATGDIVPTDVPADMRTAYVAALSAEIGTDYAAWFAARPTDAANDSDRESARTYAARRLVGNASMDRHFAEINAGNATLRGAKFAPVVGTVYTFTALSNLATSAYPNADASAGLVGAKFTRHADDAAKWPVGWEYAVMPTGETVPGSRATVGARYIGIPTAADDASAADDNGANDDDAAPDAPDA